MLVIFISFYDTCNKVFHDAQAHQSDRLDENHIMEYRMNGVRVRGAGKGIWTKHETSEMMII